MTHSHDAEPNAAEVPEGRRLSGAEHRAAVTGQSPSAHTAMGGMGSTGPITTSMPMVPPAHAEKGETPATEADTES